jgi:hypothetical protein
MLSKSRNTKADTYQDYFRIGVGFHSFKLPSTIGYDLSEGCDDAMLDSYYYDNTDRGQVQTESSADSVQNPLDGRSSVSG